MLKFSECSRLIWGQKWGTQKHYDSSNKIKCLNWALRILTRTSGEPHIRCYQHHQVGEIYQWPSDRRWTKTSFALQFAFRISMFNVSCNSHYLSHFAASFIDIWAEWSTAKNFFKYFHFNFLYIARERVCIKKTSFEKPVSKARTIFRKSRMPTLIS